MLRQANLVFVFQTLFGYCVAGVLYCVVFRCRLFLSLSFLEPGMGIGNQLFFWNRRPLAWFLFFFTFCLHARITIPLNDLVFRAQHSITLQQCDVFNALST